VPEENVIRRLAAIFSADVKDYSRLMRDDEVATIRTLNAYRELITTLIQQHHGRVVDSPGDNVLAEFASVVDGVQAAVAIQKELKTRNAKLPIVRKMEFRVGINLGDIIVEEERIYGDGVNIAARLEAMADPGGICISRTAYDQIEDKLPLGYEYLGEKTVKNIPKPIRAYKVIVEPEDLTQKLKKWTTEHIKISKTPEEVKTELSKSTKETSAVSDKKRLLTAILCLCFGIFGAHRFYAGKIKSAKVMLYTIGGLGIWYVIDTVIVLFGEFTDDEGRKIKQWV
jgi:class 3 adenylate cyclase